MKQYLVVLRTSAVTAIGILLGWCSPVLAHESDPPTTMQGNHMEHEMMSPGLFVPTMDSARGRKLFAAKGCVVCHAVNGVGGADAAALDASTMPPMMNPFDFTAQMWRGAEAMIEMQREELGEQMEFTGQELADIIAFVHDGEEQKKFSEDDIPAQIKKLMHSDEEGNQRGGEMKHDGMMKQDNMKQ